MGAKGDRICARALESKQLQLRDMDIVKDLYYRKILTGRQVQSIRFGHMKDESGYVKAMQRLKVLERLGLIRSFKVEKNYYMLTSAGAYLVANVIGVPVDDLKWRMSNEHTVQNLEHYAMTNEVGVVLDRHFVLEEYIVGVKIAMGKWFFIPDAMGTFMHRKRVHFYLELDRGTMTPRMFKEKVPRYERYYLSKRYLDFYDKFPYVLVITTKDQGRVERIAKVIEHEKVSDITFMVTTMAQFQEGPEDYIWTVPGKDRKYSLLQAGS